MEYLFIKKILNIVILTFVSYSNIIFAQSYIPIPDTLTGELINLEIGNGTKQFLANNNTNTIGYNGSYLGPTIILNKGQNVKINVKNNLTEPTSTHWHGLHVAPSNDGSPHNPILPGSTWSPTFQVLDNAATYWYHPHLHNSTMNQVLKGAAGMILIRDEAESKLNLPRQYGVDDIPLIFQFKTFDLNNKQIVLSDEQDNEVLVNGTINGILNCPAQIVRLRLLNGSSHRIFRFGLDGDLKFSQIATDGGLIDKPVELTRLNLAPGERAEILVNLSNQKGKIINLKSFGNELPQGYPGGPPMGMMGSTMIGPLDNSTINILQINVKDQTTNPILTIPTELVQNHVIPLENYTTRAIGLTAQPMMSMTNFFINGKQFNEKEINFTTEIGKTEVWNITNQTMMAHPFHIHGNSFFILKINGSDPPENLKGKKDVVIVPPMNGSVKIITKYEDFSDDEMPYMYHCHILSHEDAGMMGQFLILNPLNNSELNNNKHYKIFPNPSSQTLQIKNDNNEKIDKIIIYNYLGIKLFEKENIGNWIDISSLISGDYILQIFSKSTTELLNFVKI